MASSQTKVCFLLMLYTFTICILSGQSVERNDTILHLLEGKATGSPFDEDGTDFDIFSSLFTASSRGRQLEEDISGDITVLAPDDNAFRRALGDIGLKTASELETYENFIIYLMHTYRHPIDYLTRILYYHVIPEEFNFTALEMASLPTWDVTSTITREGDTLIDRNSPLPNPSFDKTRMNIQASNGIIHVIDYVLFPEAMRKIKFPEMENESSSPEPTVDDVEYDRGIGSVLDEVISEPTPMEEPSLETDELNQTADTIPVGPVPPSDTGSSISQVPGPRELTTPEIGSPLLIENFPGKEPSPEHTLAPLEDEGDASPPQKSPDVDISAAPIPPFKAPGNENLLEEVPAASVSLTTPTDETRPEDFSTIKLPLGPSGPLSNSSSSDTVPEVVANNESPSPFLFVGPMPKATSSSGPTVPGAVPEVAVDNKGSTSSPIRGPMPEEAYSSSSVTPEPPTDRKLD